MWGALGLLLQSLDVVPEDKGFLYVWYLLAPCSYCTYIRAAVGRFAGYAMRQIFGAF